MLDMSKIITLSIILVVAITGFIYLSSAEEPATEGEISEVVDTRPADNVQEIIYRTAGELTDVTNGETVRGIETLANTSGFARAGSAGETFIVDAEFKSLPDPSGNDFYEGWVIRRGDNISIVSTGRLEKEEGLSYTNVFTTSTDLLDHNFYVLTLEPDDNDPAPADHILEGTLRTL